MQKVARLNSLSIVDSSGQHSELGQTTSPQRECENTNSSPNQHRKEKYIPVAGASEVNRRLAAGAGDPVTGGWGIVHSRWTRKCASSNAKAAKEADDHGLEESCSSDSWIDQPCGNGGGDDGAARSHKVKRGPNPPGGNKEPGRRKRMRSVPPATTKHFRKVCKAKPSSVYLKPLPLGLAR